MRTPAEGTAEEMSGERGFRFRGEDTRGVRLDCPFSPDEYQWGNTHYVCPAYRETMSLEDWGECRHCGQRVGSQEEGVRLEVRKGTSTRSTVLCAECASLNCQNCGGSISLAAALDEDRRGGSHVMVCGRCEDEVLLAEMVEIRREGAPNYRKRICGDCLEEISVPSGYRVVREVPKQPH